MRWDSENQYRWVLEQYHEKTIPEVAENCDQRRRNNWSEKKSDYGSHEAHGHLTGAGSRRATYSAGGNWAPVPIVR